MAEFVRVHNKPSQHRKQKSAHHSFRVWAQPLAVVLKCLIRTWMKTVIGSAAQRCGPCAIKTCILSLTIFIHSSLKFHFKNINQTVQKNYTPSYILMAQFCAADFGLLATLSAKISYLNTRRILQKILHFCDLFELGANCWSLILWKAVLKLLGKRSNIKIKLCHHLVGIQG